MAEVLGDKVRLNPDTSVDGDVNIYVKPVSIDVVGYGDYLDFLDGGHFYNELHKRPDIKVIACTEHSRKVLEAEFPNEIILIPHHHINLERKARERTDITVCGYIGSYSPRSERHNNWLKEQFDKLNVGVTLITNFEYKTREDAINTYMDMDILVIADWWLADHNPHKIPTKMINAASFGIPSIAFPRAGYEELEHLYIRANNLDELVSNIKYLMTNRAGFDDLAQRLRVFAEGYHIENIAKLYLDLK
jgi:predicted GNAT superfamily acetyltransferase